LFLIFDSFLVIVLAANTYLLKFSTQVFCVDFWFSV